MRTRVFVSGPISRGDMAANIKQATDAAVALLRAGYSPLCPHLACYMGGMPPSASPCGLMLQDWYQADLAWVAVSDAVLRLPGESAGADLETGLANELGIPVYFSVAALIAVQPTEGITL